MVDFVNILELGQDFTVLDQTNFTTIFLNGDSFTYTSIVADQAKAADASQIPSVLQLNIFGVNAQNQPVVNLYAIKFTNDCFAYPVIMPGNSAGWTSFVSGNEFDRTDTFSTFTADSSCCFLLDFSFSSAEERMSCCPF